MHNYKELEIWKRSLQLSISLHQQLNDSSKIFGSITHHLLRTSVSIPSNIAEGCSRSSEKEFQRYLEISLGSAFELETQLLIANSINNTLEQSIIETKDIQKMIIGFKRTLSKV